LPRQCSVCTHPARPTITDLLIRRVSYRRIADRFGVSETAVSRHTNEHLAGYVQQALASYDEHEGLKVVRKLEGMLERLDAFLETAEANQDAREFVMVAAELRKELELIAKLEGELAVEGTTTLHLHPEWIQIRTTIIDALTPHPAAREDVIKAIKGATNGAS
jgi:hypothetical protein